MMREIAHKSPHAEYIYVTDDRSITSKTWEVRYIDNPNHEDIFNACYNIRFNPFDYATTDVVLRIDGSIQCLDKTDEIIKYFNRGGYDICLLAHPKRLSMSEEYDEWCKTREYSRTQANRVLSHMTGQGYDVTNYRGLYQFGFMIQRRNPVNEELNAATLSLLRELAPEGKAVERIDQTIGSFIINSQFSDRLKVMVVDERILHSKYFRHFPHGSWKENEFFGFVIQPYWANKPVKIAKLKYRAKAYYSGRWLPLPVVSFIHLLKRWVR